MQATGRGRSGVEIDSASTLALSTFRDGKIVRVHERTHDRAEALEAAGLSE